MLWQRRAANAASGGGALAPRRVAWVLPDLKAQSGRALSVSRQLACSLALGERLFDVNYKETPVARLV
jgi:hypothetical protein